MAVLWHRPLQVGRFVFQLVVVVGALFAFGACGGGSGGGGAGALVPVDDSTTATGLAVRTVSAELSAGVEPSADFGAIESLVQSFLNVRAAVIVGDLGTEALAPLAGGVAIDVVVAEREYNDSQIELARPGATIVEMVTWPNLTAIGDQGDRLVVDDCTERQEVNGYDQLNLYFVEHRYTLEPVEDSWRVMDMVELHNGFLERDDRFGCVPQSYIERAEATATAMWTEFYELGRNPTDHGQLSSVFGQDLAAELSAAAKTAAEANIVLSSAEEVTFRAIGIDTRADLIQLGSAAGAKTVLVELCRSFPDGLERTDTATGVVEQGLPPGARLTEWLYVRLNTGLSRSVDPDQVVGLETAPGACGEQR